VKAIHDFRLVHGAIFFYHANEVVLSKFLYREVLPARNDRAFICIAVQALQRLRMHLLRFFRLSRSVQ